jgi:hypothetical protein
MFVAIALLAAAQASQAPQPSQTVAAASTEKKVCRSLEKTGSLLRKKVCLTEQEWQAIDKQNRSNADQMADTPNRNRS